MQQYLSLLGLKVQDAVTGFSGVVTIVGFDLYGCVQCVLTPSLDAEGDLRDGRWFDAKRLTILDPTPVMQAAEFGALSPGDEAGPQDKPAAPRMPLR